MLISSVEVYKRTRIDFYLYHTNGSRILKLQYVYEAFLIVGKSNQDGARGMY